MIHTHPPFVASTLRDQRIMSEADETEVRSAEEVERETDSEEETTTTLRARNTATLETPGGTLLDVLDVPSSPTRTPSLIPTFGTAKTTTADEWRPIEPKMGGLKEVGHKKFIAWTGGKPDLHWTTLDDINAAPRSVMQYRSVGETSVKGYISRTR